MIIVTQNQMVHATKQKIVVTRHAIHGTVKRVLLVQHVVANTIDIGVIIMFAMRQNVVKNHRCVKNGKIAEVLAQMKNHNIRILTTDIIVLMIIAMQMSAVVNYTAMVTGLQKQIRSVNVVEQIAMLVNSVTIITCVAMSQKKMRATMATTNLKNAQIVKRSLTRMSKVIMMREHMSPNAMMSVRIVKKI